MTRYNSLSFLLLLGIFGTRVSASVSAAKTDSSANPIRKIVTLLQDMSKEIEAEGKKEQELYDKFMCYCETTQAELSKSAESAQSKVTDLTAKLEEDTAEKSTVEQELKEHKEERASVTEELKQATAIRGKEAEDYAASSADAKANFEAVSGAIPALEKGMGGAALMQIPHADRLARVVEASNVVNSFDQKSVLAFLEQSRTGEAQTGDYVPASGQIVGILKQMNDQMASDIAEADKSEASAKVAFGELTSAKNREIQIATDAIQSKTGRSGTLALSVVQTQDSIDDSSSELADSQKFLAELSAQCTAKQSEWAERQSTRAQEVEAISQAIGVLNDDDALDIFKKAVPAPAAAAGFLQAKHDRASKLRKAQALVYGAAATHKSQQLELLSYALTTRVRAEARATAHGQQAEGNFDFINQMIDRMAKLLTAEGAEDAKQKEWCEGEFDKSANSAKATQDEIDGYKATISELEDQIAGLGDEAKNLENQIVAMDASVAQATLQRKQENTEYTETASLNEAAAQLVEKAKQKLYKFYKPELYKAPPKRELSQEEKIYANAGRDEWNSPPPAEAYISGTEQLKHEWEGFVQVRAHVSRSNVAPPAPPETFGAYQKKGEKSGGVLYLMDDMIKDLKSDIAEGERDEEKAQKDYNELMENSAASRAQNAKSITDLEGSKAVLEGKLTEAKEANVLTVGQLEDIHKYIGNLHSNCDFILENFDLRAEARTNEEESLKTAKAVLAGAGFAR